MTPAFLSPAAISKTFGTLSASEGIHPSAASRRTSSPAATTTTPGSRSTRRRTWSPASTTPILSFWVVDADLQEQSICPVPRWDRFPYLNLPGKEDGVVELSTPSPTRASFINCSRPVTSNRLYAPLACRSTSSSFVYVLVDDHTAAVRDLEPSCGYLGMTPLADDDHAMPYSQVDGYAHVVAAMRAGFPVRFPYNYESSGSSKTNKSIKECLQARYFYW